jgi:ribonuclease R
MEVEREVVDLYRALFMRAHIGETFEGTVTGLVGAGAFASLDAPFVDVMIRAEAMGRDRYELDEDQMRFVARRSGDTVALGDRVVVTVEDVAILRRTVYAWRHAPDVTDSEPLKHSPFRVDEPPRSKKKRSALRAGTDRPPPRKKKKTAPRPGKKKRR